MQRSNYSDIGNVTQKFLSMIKLPEEGSANLNYLLVMPPVAANENAAFAPSSGIALVCSALKASGRTVFTLNLTYKKDHEKWLKHKILTNRVDVVLTGGDSVQYGKLKAIVDMAKEIKPDIVTVVGGSIITADPAVAMEALETVDYGVIGEGEITVNALAYALETGSDPAELDGIICKRNGKWSIKENWPVINDLDMLPFPDYEGFDYSQSLDKSKNRPEYEDELRENIDSTYTAYVTTSRSCIYNCTYCFHPCGRKYRRKSLDIIFKEIDWALSQYPIDVLRIMDELTFSDDSFTLEFCRRIKSYNVIWTCSSLVGEINNETLKLIKESGGNVFFGIESTDDRILKSMRKKTSVAQIDQMIDLHKKYNIKPGGNLIFGDPEETMETFWNSMNWWQRNRELGIRTFMIRAYPGSRIYKDACAKGIIKDPVQFLKDGCPLVNLTKMTDDEYKVLPILIDIVRQEGKLEEMIVEKLKDYALNVSGVCPCCKRHISFPYFEFAITNGLQTCPFCGKPIMVNPIEACDFEKMNQNVLDVLDGQNAAVWAVNANNFYWLLQAMPALKAENVRFINQYEIVIPHNGKTVKSFEGKPVEVPDILADSDIETVLVPNNPKVFEEIKAQCKARFPEVKKIVHITELM